MTVVGRVMVPVILVKEKAKDEEEEEEKVIEKTV